MHAYPVGYQITLSLADSEGNTVDFTLANTKDGTEVIAAADFPLPNDALAQSLMAAAHSVCESESIAALLVKAIDKAHSVINARITEERRRNQQPASSGGDAPF